MCNDLSLDSIIVDAFFRAHPALFASMRAHPVLSVLLLLAAVAIFGWCLFRLFDLLDECRWQRMRHKIRRRTGEDPGRFWEDVLL